MPGKVLYCEVDVESEMPIILSDVANELANSGAGFLAGLHQHAGDTELVCKGERLAIGIIAA